MLKQVADTTNGKYYDKKSSADLIKEFSFTKSKSIDKATDSNGVVPNLGQYTYANGQIIPYDNTKEFIKYILRLLE